MVAIEGSMPTARVSSGQSDLLRGLTFTGADDTYKNAWRMVRIAASGTFQRHTTERAVEIQ